MSAALRNNNNKQDDASDNIYDNDNEWMTLTANRKEAK